MPEVNENSTVEGTTVPTASVDTTQKVETNAYVPTYKIKPEFKKAILQAVGDRPFNEIAGLIAAIDVPVMDHNTLQQILNAIGQFPYIRVESLLKNINSYIQLPLE